MLVAGDEMGRTQGGNNNAYCQDNEVSWHDWEHIDSELLDFCRQLIALRREHPTFRRRRYFQGQAIRGTVDLGWCKPDGSEMTDEDWEVGHARTIGLFINGQAITHRDQRGLPVVDDSFLLLFSAHDEPVDWVLPTEWGGPWTIVLETSGTHEELVPVGGTLKVPARSVVVLTDGIPA
jgi:glycogen operon protein